jgi:hypothetical protein
MPLGSVITSLPTDQEIVGLISGSARNYFLMENYSTVCTGWVFNYFVVLFTCSVLCRLRRSSPHSSDYSSGGPAIVFIFLYLFNRNFQIPWHLISSIKLKKKKMKIKLLLSFIFSLDTTVERILSLFVNFKVKLYKYNYEGQKIILIIHKKRSFAGSCVISNNLGLVS